MAVKKMQGSCQLYVVVEAGPAAVERLAMALSAVEVASCLIAPVAGAVLTAAAAKPLIDLAQARDIAALIAGDAALARTLRADGMHLPPTKELAQAYAEARMTLGQNAIVGVDPGLSRHDAMTLAEAGADYVAFGAPSHLQDRDKARARRDDLVAWWAEIFEVPCVAFDVETPREAEMLARAGADFVAVILPAAQSPTDARDHIAEIGAAIRVAGVTG
jgi:thiamine-phosphate pyrophosphorylase